MKDAIPQIISTSGGMIVENAEMPSEYDSMHYVTFENQEAIDTYFHHEAHQAFIAQNKALWENVLVLNATIDE